MKISKTPVYRAALRLLANLLVAGAVASANAVTTWFVKPGTPPPHNGQGWATAYMDIQDVFDNGSLQAGDSIWVAAGTYKPSVPYAIIGSPPTARHKTFRPPSGVKIYG